MSRTKTGADNAEQPKTTSWSSSAGVMEDYIEDFASSTAEADAIARAQTLACESWTVAPIEGGCYRLTAKIPKAAIGAGIGGGINNPNIPLNDIWELQPNMVEKDILDADIAINNLTVAQKDAIKAAVAANSVGSLSGNSLKYYKLLRAGVTSVRVFEPVLRHTLIVRADYRIAASLTNVGKILTTAQLQSFENVPGILLFNLPTGSKVRTDALDVDYGWLKKYPTVTQISGGKWQISQEWEYGLWSTDLYVGV